MCKSGSTVGAALLHRNEAAPLEISRGSRQSAGARCQVASDAVVNQLTSSRSGRKAGGYAASRSLTLAFPRSSATQPPTSSNALMRLRGDGMYCVKWRTPSVRTPNMDMLG